MLPICILQLIVLPYLSIKMDSEAYGLALTVISVLSITSLSIGITLNNIRLLYDQKLKQPDNLNFPIVLLICIIFNSIAVWGWCKSLIEVSRFDMALILVCAFLMVVKAYYEVYFLIHLDYRRVLLNNVFLSLGYIAGAFLLNLADHWQLVYLSGLMASCVFIFSYVRKVTFVFQVTGEIWTIIGNVSVLFVSILLTKMIVYVDRIMLYPMLGGTIVSYYYISSLLGKTISMGIGALQGVMLSYISKINKIKEKMFLWMLVASMLVGLGMYLLAVIASKPVLKILYRQDYINSLPLVPITSAASIIYSIGTLMNTVIMKTSSMIWQIVIAGINIIVYCSLAYIGYARFGLYGFCTGILFANLFRLILIVGIYFFRGTKQGEANEL